MEQLLDITYYHHSGFSAALDDTLLVFDYWTGENGELPESKRITPEFLTNFKEIVVFISHEHPDHMDPEVFQWRNDFPVTYVVAHDMPIGTRGKRMAPGDTLTLSPKVSIRAFDSTDLGVSFLVDLNGIRIFHAGDLNFWHWREESTLKEIEEADEDFRKAIAPLQGESIDVAFFPVDPRQGRLFDAGANTFILSVKPRILLPMHFWGRAEIAVEFARRARCRETEVLAMTRYGEQIRLQFEDDGYLTIHLLSAPEPVPTPKISELPIMDGERVDNTNVNLQGYEEGDPFSETDLPVKIDE
ncbi:MAG: MBL fold metallo-hydrolase [Clostridia bacterium]|nr:MBL fold metallo-hydrolase [Clostridia bacterium]